MRIRIIPGPLALLFLLFTGIAATADTASDSKTVGNVVVYMGLLPAEMIRGHPPTHAEATMHGGPPKQSGVYHVVIALFDAKSFARITKADISARVSEVGLTGEEKKLEPMEIAGTETYGNYFPMTGHGPFRISLTIHVPGQAQEIKVVFEHRHE